jgi:hypothetical protein
MKVIRYRKIIVIGRLLATFSLVFVSILLLLAGLFSDDGVPRQILYFFLSLFGFVFFGKFFLLMIYVLFKDPTMFSYDADKIIVKNTEMNRKNIAKVELAGEVPTGFLGTKSYGFILHGKDKKMVYIPTYYVVTKKEEAEIFTTLQQYVSNHKKL